ncbi:GNAT family N-acetyltransferase [Aliikangiella sp. IMCC44359]|uniref:GNAT family N-acetyltransferase n=1 Tax=Aliikangiella sp. IMCC44359 TaxID=3459125 RepID=UPI00403A88CD
MSNQLSVSFQSICQIKRDEWTNIINSDYPFIQYEFLHALEISQCVSEENGWIPAHLTVKDGENIVALVPLYIKKHSYGEYVFDFQWADAFHQSGFNYYPKLITAIPFTPVTGQRIYFAKGYCDDRLFEYINQTIKEFCKERNIYSWHILFNLLSESSAFHRLGDFKRTGMQYHWFNRDYASFDDFLLNCRAKPRKNIKRERRIISEQEIETKVIEGAQVSELTWKKFYSFYKMTYLKRSGHSGYLTYEFFSLIGRLMKEYIVLIAAYKNKEMIAASLFFKDHSTLYGRYWGCNQEFEFLHFELCYYQGIEYCIQHQLNKFDAGAQGEHKIQRGFEPIETYSNHWIAHPQFYAAISHFVVEEEKYVKQAMQELTKKLPFKSIRHLKN